MNNRKKAFIFGSSKYAIEIANSVENVYDIEFFVTSDSCKIDFDGEYIRNVFDLSDAWYNEEKFKDYENIIIFCALEEEAENVFLAISLRSNFQHLILVAIAKNKESAQKLKIAGVNKVIPIEQTTAEIISDIIHNPIASQVLHGILYEKNDLKLAQIEVENAEIFDGEYPADIDWSRYRGVVVLSIMHKDLTTEFIYSSKAKRNRLQNGDMIIVVGYEADIQEFEKLVGSRRYVNWSDWSW
ncbi:potassium channel protein [hydrothermal vent metagenome]|uniref:Potassium channel protein n=1 Tax=hydrothermal vent metagenome TaxID=652676 RepID=A0A1W1BBJ7_9ZZZZ